MPHTKSKSTIDKYISTHCAILSYNIILYHNLLYPIVLSFVVFLYCTVLYCIILSLLKTFKHCSVKLSTP